jgi:hypothetical protein
MKLCPAGALIPQPHGQENNSPDRHDQEVSRHDTFRALGTAPFYMGYSMTIGPARLGGPLPWRNDCDANVCKKTHWHRPLGCSMQGSGARLAQALTPPPSYTRVLQ